MSGPDPDLKRRVLASAAAEPSPTRSVRQRIDALAATGVGVAVVGIFFEFGGIREGGAPRSLPLMIGTLAGTLAITIAVALLVVRRGNSMLGRPGSHSLFAVVVAPLMFFAWKVLYSSLFEGGLDYWPTRVGHKCLGLSLVLGALPLAALALS